MIKNIYRTYQRENNMLHWRKSGASMLGMLCGRGTFIDWSLDRWDWDQHDEVKYCQECEVQYVLEIMS